MTLRDVAARAGVSPRTVSNVVNDFRYVSPAMRTKVQAALDELGYKPNLLARGLRQGRTGILTLLLPDIAVPYFGELAHEVVERASQLGFTVMIDETSGQPQRERALLDAATQSSWVDGVLLSSLGLKARDLAGPGSHKPVVLLGEVTALTALDHVGIDNVAASRDAVQHLVQLGPAPHRRPRREQHRIRCHLPSPAEGIPPGTDRRRTASRRLVCPHTGLRAGTCRRCRARPPQPG